jgi:hypothetical protein
MSSLVLKAFRRSGPALLSQDCAGYTCPSVPESTVFPALVGFDFQMVETFSQTTLLLASH